MRYASFVTSRAFHPVSLALALAIVGYVAPSFAQTCTLLTPISVTAEVNNASAPNTLDSNPNEFSSPTFWQAAAENPCITYDLGSVEKVCGFRETSGPFPPNPFTAFVSLDGLTFVQAAAGTLTQWTFGDHFFAAQDSQFLRLCLQRTDDTGFGELSDFRALVLAGIDVAIDIKPGSFPNSINLGSGGAVPLAILSTAGFDAGTVDPLTIALAGASVKLRGKGTPMASLEDVNGDGLLDLVVHVETESLQLSEGDTQATLDAQTFDGTAIRGTDSVRIVP